MKTETCIFLTLPHKFFSTVFNDEIIIYQKDQKLFAISGFCPHFGGPLSVEESKINCFWHDWSFDPETLKCVNKKINIRLRSYGVKLISTNQVLIEDAS